MNVWERAARDSKIVALRAAAQFPSLLTKPQRSALIDLLYTLQRPDGGWSLSDLGAWKRRDGTPLETRSDGYATAVITLALEENGVSVLIAPQQPSHAQDSAS